MKASEVCRLIHDAEMQYEKDKDQLWDAHYRVAGIYQEQLLPYCIDEIKAGNSEKFLSLAVGGEEREFIGIGNYTVEVKHDPQRSEGFQYRICNVTVRPESSDGEITKAEAEESKTA